MRALPLISAAALAAVGCRARPSSIRRAPQRVAEARWRVVGPGGGGTMVHPTISPHDPAVVIEGCDMSGTYVTRDAGGSWEMINFGGAPASFAFDPNRPAVIYAGATALWRSEDTGRSWRMVFPDPARGVSVRHATDDADMVIESGDPTYPRGAGWVRFDAIALDPARPDDLYVAFQHRSAARREPSVLMASTDRGRRWQLRGTFAPERIYAVSVAQGAATVVGERGVYLEEGGAWRLHPTPARVTSASFAREGARGLLYATVETAWEGRSLRGGVVLSEDGGRTWQARNAGLLEGIYRPGEGDPPRIEPVAASAQHGASAYVGFRGLRLGAGGGGLYNGIARTTTAGGSWRIVHRESNASSDNLDATWLDPRAPTGGLDIWFDAPQDLAVGPRDPATCYATDLFRTYRTTDGGSIWRQVYSRSEGGDRWVTRGLDVTTSYEVYADPLAPQRIFIAYTDIGLFRSEDGGRSWTGSSDGVPPAWRNTSYALAFDPAARGLVWGAFSGTHDLPRVKMWHERPLASFRGGVCVSTDGGRTWRTSGAGLPDGAVTHVVLDPASPRGARTLYAAVFGHGVFRSGDNGRTWAAMRDGIEGEAPFAWRLTLGPDRSLYVVLARRGEGDQAGDEGALLRWSEAGRRWTRLPIPTRGPSGLAVDPRDPRRLYLAGFGERAGAGPVAGGGVFVSEDGGARWRLVLSEAVRAYDVTVDPRAPGTLYACGFDRAAWRSTDRGEHWSRLAGYTFQYGHRVVPDPSTPAMVYVTTFGGSVWHGPAAGDPTFVDPVSLR